MEVIVGKTYKHFKGGLCKVITVAKNSETLEDMVIYEHDMLYGQDHIICL